MEIVHRFGFNKKMNLEATINKLGLKYSKIELPGGSYGITVVVNESDPAWPAIAKIIKENDLPDQFNTEFTKEEILEAEWVRLMPVFQQGYPQPEESWKKYTYENECPKCGAGYTQIAPFHMKNNPRMGKHDFMDMFWIYEVFVTPRVIEKLELEEIKGIEVWPTIIHRSGQASNAISQLVFPNIAGPALAQQDQIKPVQCSECNEIKYGYHKKGYMHLMRDNLSTDTDVQLTHEWFGSGTPVAFREILISNKLASLILDNSWKGLSLKPVKIVSSRYTI